MKDSLSVKELVDENYESQGTCENSFQYRALIPDVFVQIMDSSTNNDGKESLYEEAEETSGDMSKIEAELEAELERLALNMNTSNLERRFSDLVEVKHVYFLLHYCQLENLISCLMQSENRAML